MANFPVNYGVGICIISTTENIVSVNFCQFVTNSGHLRKRELRLRNCLHQIGMRACLWAIFLIYDLCGRSQSIVGSITTW